MKVFRFRYTVTDFYPVMKGPFVSHTESQRFYFRTFFFARAFALLLKLLNLAVPKDIVQYYSVWLHPIACYNLSIEDLGVEYADSGPWRSYSLETSGDTLKDLFLNAQIAETDQDGGSLECYGLDDGNYEAGEQAYKAIVAYAKKEGLK